MLHFHTGKDGRSGVKYSKSFPIFLIFRVEALIKPGAQFPKGVACGEGREPLSKFLPLSSFVSLVSNVILSEAKNPSPTDKSTSWEG